MIDSVFKILKESKRIADIKNISGSTIGVYVNRSYKYLFRFNYSIHGLVLSVLLGVPDDWDRKLMDFYLEEYREIPYMPHVGNNGALCLFDIEDVLINKNFEGILKQLIERMEKVVLEGIQELNKIDFIEEFQSYWEKLPNIKVLKSFVEISQRTKVIKYSDDKKQVVRNKHDKFIDVSQKQGMYKVYASDSGLEFNKYDIVNTQKNGIYIYIEPREFIYPPDWRKGLHSEYLRTLIQHESVKKKDWSKCLDKCSNQPLLIFCIKQPNGTINTFGVLANNFNFLIDTDNNKNSSYELIPCSVYRCDGEFLKYRCRTYKNIKDSKVLVIGCGSIGGYLVSELVKSGFTKIDLVDNDLLKEENIYRHLLGMEYVNQYKSEALTNFVERNFVEVKPNSYVDTIEELLTNEDISLEQFDIIISAVGNHNVNRWINQYVRGKQVKKPVVYLWNEVLGIGSHVAIFSIEQTGCYECLFSEDKESGVFYCKASYCEKGQNFIKKVQGCGSSFVPYSSTTSLITAAAGIKTVINYLEGKIDCNYLMSIKGDDFYFREAGYETSNRYKIQQDKEYVLDGNKIMYDKCLCCGS